MGKSNCAVIGCSNRTYKLSKWKESFCDKHSSKCKDCSCERPFRLFMFPSELRNGEQRQRWIKTMKREGPKKTVWKPCNSDRVCSDHFEGGEPTLTHPDPTKNLGYDLKKTIKPRRKLFKRAPVQKKRKVSNTDFEKSSQDIPFKGIKFRGYKISRFSRFWLKIAKLSTR